MKSPLDRIYVPLSALTFTQWMLYLAIIVLITAITMPAIFQARYDKNKAAQSLQQTNTSEQPYLGR